MRKINYFTNKFKFKIKRKEGITNEGESSKVQKKQRGPRIEPCSTPISKVDLENTSF